MTAQRFGSTSRWRRRWWRCDSPTPGTPAERRARRHPSCWSCPGTTTRAWSRATRRCRGARRRSTSSPTPRRTGATPSRIWPSAGSSRGRSAGRRPGLAKWASQITTEPPAAVVPPVGGGPMTGRQAAYLATLAAQAGEEATEALTRLEATGRITDASGAHRAQDPGVGAQDRVGDRGDRRRSPASHGGPTSSGGSPARRGALEAAEPRPALP